MKNELIIKIIESGRLENAISYKKPNNDIVCKPLHCVQCASYTNCTKETFGTYDKYGDFHTFCNNKDSYSSCNWIVPYSPYGGK